MSIKDIHNSDIFGSFIEIGAGVPVASALFSESGASKTVFNTFSPYNLDARKGLTKYPGRSVSAEFVQSITENHDFWAESGFTPPDYNTTFVSSFQIGSDICSHGWIALRYKDTSMQYHITLPTYIRDRRLQIEEIGRVGLQILQGRNIGVQVDHCDMVLEDGEPNLERTKQMLAHFSTKTDYFGCLAFHKDGHMCRPEDILREYPVDCDYIPVFKGSFNPVHKAHLAIAELAESDIGYRPVFMISTNSHGKTAIPPEDLLDRVAALNDLGYHVLVNSGGYFDYAIRTLVNRSQKRFIWVMGADTYLRWVECLPEEWSVPSEEATMFVVNRPDSGFDLSKVVGIVNLVDSGRGLTPLEDLRYNDPPQIIVKDCVFEEQVSSTEIRKAQQQ